MRFKNKSEVWACERDDCLAGEFEVFRPDAGCRLDDSDGSDLIKQHARLKSELPAETGSAFESEVEVVASADRAGRHDSLHHKDRIRGTS